MAAALFNLTPVGSSPRDTESRLVLGLDVAAIDP
ncbi:MAG: hypothetical protein ACI8XO_003360 [Verrucomicrobiales bacterium]|jgi:hypothetical protein